MMKIFLRKINFSFLPGLKVYVAVLAVLLVATTANSQTKTIQGKVVDDAKNQPIPAATVRASGANVTVRTKTDGSFTIIVPEATTAVVVSSVGFVTKTAALTNVQNLVVSLSVDKKVEEDVIVTGVGGPKKRKEYTGAATTISAAVIENTPVGSFDQLLQGRVPGLSVLSGSGQPGNAASVVLRGQTSITGGTGPLYIIDGIAVEPGVFQAINPNDFQTIQVLQDAQASALYGSRGAAGVIVATTRRGATGKTRFTVNTQQGRTLAPSFNYPMMNTQELLAAQEAFGRIVPSPPAFLPGWVWSPNNPNNLAPAAAANAARLLDSTRALDTDWDDVFFRSGRFTRNEISATGGSGRIRFFSNLGHYGEEGITLRSNMNRFTWRNNIDFEGDKLKVRVSTLTSYVRRSFQESETANSLRNPFFAPRLTPGYQRLFRPGLGKTSNDADLITNVATGVGNQFSGPNLYQAYFFNQIYNDQLKTLLTADIDYKITEDLKLNVVAGGDFRETQNSNYNDPRIFFQTSSADVRTRSGSMTESLGRTFQYNVRPTLNFNRKFAGKHGVDVTAGTEVLGVLAKSFSVTGFGVDFRRPNTIASITPGNVQNLLVPLASGGRTQRAITSAFAFGSYTYDNKYTFSASIRRDGSSQLPELNRFNNFYSFGASWDIGKEEFMQKQKFFTDLRLRATYGTAANADNFNFGDFGYIRQFDIGSDGGGLQTLGVSNLGNPNAGWEFTKQFNVGLEFSMLDQRLRATTNFYIKNTIDAYATQLISQVTGFGSFQANAATVLNRGIDWDVSYDIVRRGRNRITFFVNGSYNHNEVTSLGGLQNFQAGTALITMGKPLGTHWEVGWAGVDPASGRALYLDSNRNLTNVYSTANRLQDFSTSLPFWIGGVGFRGTFGNFDFEVFGNYVAGNKRVNNLEFFTENPAGFLAVGLRQAQRLDFWTRPGDVANTQGPTFANQFSSKYIQDASFFRLRNFVIGYTLPESLTKKLRHISGARFNIQAQNLFTITNWRGYDPEDNNNISLSEFPVPRVITFGLNIDF
jgi:TonB-linked SusC/RagA family outer membrane protein